MARSPIPRLRRSGENAPSWMFNKDSAISTYKVRAMLIRQTFSAVVLSVTLLSAYAEDSKPIRGTSVDDWQGFGILSGGKGYVKTPLGQVHYRDIGPREDKHPIVLLHQTPMSMLQYTAAQKALAEIGVRSIAVDNLGNGMSDMPPKQPLIPDYADTLVYLLDHLGVDKASFAGHHTGSNITASFAANNPDRVVSVILHGAAVLTEEERHDMLHNLKRIPRTPKHDGSHLTRFFRHTTEGTPQEALDRNTMAILMLYMQGPDIGHWAAYHYDMVPDLKAIKAPGLILSDKGDAFNFADVRAAEIRPDFKFMEFAERGLGMMSEPERWAKVVSEFTKSAISAYLQRDRLDTRL